MRPDERKIGLYGYVRANIPELKVREKQRYEAWYCGLCRSIGKRYSLLSRLVLSYDSAFLAMLLSDVSGIVSPCEKHTCPVRPLGAKKLMVRDGTALAYAADVCVILAEFKIRDDAQDGKKMRKAAMLPLRRTFKKAKRNAPELYRAVREGIEKLNAVETERDSSLDLAANAFGAIMRDVFRLAPLSIADEETEERTRAVLSELGYWLGRAIYFLDAWDDRAEDEKRGLYNPFLITNTSKEDADFEINYSINSAISAYNLLDCGGMHAPDRGIEDNVFYLGLFSMWDSVAGGANRKKKRSMKNADMNAESFAGAFKKDEKERTESDK